MGEQEYIISKLQSKRKLGKLMKKDADYKPHDHVNLEDSPTSKQPGMNRIFKQQDEKLLQR